MFGTAGSSGAAGGIDPGAVEGVLLLLRVMDLLTDRDRERVRADLASLVDAMKQHLEIRADLEQRERSLAEREAQSAKTAERLAAYEASVAEKERQAMATIQRAEAKTAEFAALKAEIRSWPKAAA
jgi:hypothetical protein